MRRSLGRPRTHPDAAADESADKSQAGMTVAEVTMNSEGLSGTLGFHVTVFAAARMTPSDFVTASKALVRIQYPIQL
jgi:hypothetical protein